MASPARWASLLSYFVILLLGTAATFYLQQVQRAPLPREEIAALVNYTGLHKDSAFGTSSTAWPAARISVSALPGTFDTPDELRAFREHLAAALGQDAAVEAAEPPSGLAGLRPCTDAAEPSAACLESLEVQAQEPDVEGAPLRSTFDLLVAPSSGCPTLVLSAGRGAVLRWRHGGQLADAEALASAVARRLRETWLRRIHIRDGAALFEVAPAYVFSFFLVSDCRRRVSWDFLGGVHAPFLQRFLARLRMLVDLEIDSQVVQCGSLGDVATAQDGSTVVTESSLQAHFLSRAGDWPGDTVTRGARWLPPLVRLVAFWPSEPLHVADAQGRTQRSFAVQGWGAVAMAGGGETCDEAACSGAGADALPPCEARQAASAWVSNLRSWLQLPADGPASDAGGGTCDAEHGLALLAARPSLDGIAAWELLIVARAFLDFFVRRTAEALQNLLELVDSLSELTVRQEIGETCYAAAAAARGAADSAAAGSDLVGALASARRALHLALTASHDDTVVAAMYFSWEFKYAVYLPLGLPLVVPICAALWRQLQRARETRAFHRNAAKAAAAAGEEVS